MDVELRHLRCFVAVADELSFTAAGTRLHLTQQSVSATITQLERQVGTLLLTRTTRSVSLTAAGAALLEDARRLLAGVEDALERARSQAGQLHGRLRLGCSFDLQILVTPALRSLGVRHRDLRVDVTLGSQGTLVHELRARRLDALVTWRRPDGNDDLLVQHVLTVPLLAVLRAEDPLAVAEAVPRSAAASRTLVMHRREVAPGPYDEVLEQLYEGREPGPLQFIDVLTSGHEARLAALLSPAGRGSVALLADFAYRAHEKTGLIARSLVPPMTVSVQLLSLTDAPSSTHAATSLLATLLSA